MALANKLERASATARKFTLEYLEQITNNFSEEHVIGRGGYGVVYKGVLENGEVIALKKLCWRPDSNDTEFSTEFNNLMRVQHPNITRLVGYCYHQGHELIEHKGEYIFPHVEQRVLCFEYLKGGSLDKKISDESCGLDWHTRFKIINGVSLGLDYLHNGSKDSIYHLDLKPANILLDKNMVPKIGDFGLSRLFPSAQTIITNKNIGTLGYMPPEYIDKGEITSKHDVFSLGVIIIRIMAGDDGYFKSAHMSSQEFLELVQENWRKRLQATMLSHTSDQIETCIKIALRCVEVDRNKRPTIAEIVNELNKHIHIADGDAKRGKVTSAEKTSEDVSTPKLASVPLTPLHVNSQPAHTEEPYMQPQVPDQIIVKPLQRRWLSSWRDQIILKLSDLAGLAVVLAVLLRPLAVALAVYLVARIVISSVAYLVVSSVAYFVARIVISSVANLVARIALSSAGCFISGLVVCFILTRLEAATYLGSVVERIRHRTLPYAKKAVLGCFVLGLVVNFPNAYFVLGLVVGFCCTEHWVAFPATYFLLGLVVRSIPRTLPTAYFILGFVVSFILTAVAATSYLGSVVERARRQIIVPYPKTILLGCFLLGSVVSFPNAYCVLGLVVGLCCIKHWVALPATYFLLGLVVGSFLTTLPTAYFILDLVASFILLCWVTSSYVGFISWSSVLQN